MLEQAKQTYQSLKKNKYTSLKNKTEDELHKSLINESAGPFSKSLNPNTS